VTKIPMPRSYCGVAFPCFGVLFRTAKPALTMLCGRHGPATACASVCVLRRRRTAGGFRAGWMGGPVDAAINPAQW